MSNEKDKQEETGMAHEPVLCEGQHVKILFLSDMVEENGRTVKENNMMIEHKIPIGTLVEVDCDYISSHKVRLYVKEHTRDCDGTPLYSLGFKGESEPWMTSGGYSDDCLKVIEQ